MAIDPRSIIREILSRRPDLHAAFAPQAQALGVQIAGLKPAVEARRRLEAANALRSGQVQDTTLGPVPPNMGSFAPAPKPLPVPEFSGETRRRLTAADASRGALSPGYAGYEAQRASMLSPMGDQGPLQPLPGSQDYGRERERALMRSPFGEQEPLGGRDDLAAASPGLADRVPMPPSFGAGPGSAAARLPQFRPSFAPGTQERIDNPLARLPQARPPEIGPPMPTPGSGPPSPNIANDISGLPPEVASLMGGGSPIAPGLPPSGAPFSPYGPDASLARMPQPRTARLPQARPPQGMSLTVEPGDLGPNPPDLNQPPPLSPDQRISGAPGAGPPPPIDPGIAAAAQRAALGARPVPTQRGFQPAPGFDQALGAVPPPASLPPLSPQAAELARDIPNPAAALQALPSRSRGLATGKPLDLAAGIGAPVQPLGSTVLSPDTLDPSGQFASVGQRIAPYAGTGAGATTARLPRARPDFNQPGDLTAAPAGTAPVGAVTPGADLPPPSGSTSSILTPQQIQRTMGTQALYNQPPPGMVLPPGVTLPDVGRLGFGDLNVDPSKAPVHRYGSNTGKYVGAGLGALKGLAGGPVGAVVGAALGYKGGKRVGGLADRDFGLGARFSNPNYPQGIVANPPPIMGLDASGVPAITPPVDIPVTEANTGGIFGQGRRAIGGAMQKAIAAVTSGRMSPDAASKAFGVPKDSLHDSLGSVGSGGGGMGQSSGGGGGGYTGGSYGGYGGGRIGEGVGGAYRNR